MIVGISPSVTPEAFFPGEGPWPRISPGRAISSLWTVVGNGDVVWYELPDDPRWGRWLALLIVSDVPFSQFDGMVDHLRQGGIIPDRVACIALSGRGFHGQRNRAWSVRRGNLHLVVHFAPHRPARDIGHGFTLLPAVAAIRAIRRLGDGAVEAGVKWVNDILVARRKVGGFLASTQTQDGIVRNAVLGLGINVDSTPEVLATPFVPAVGCLRDLHRGYSLSTLLPVLLQELQELYDQLLAEGFWLLLQAYRAYAVVIGRPVRVWPETESSSADQLRGVAPLAQGVVAAIADDLSLVIEGHPEPVTRGRLAEEDACRQYGL
jgi:biotin-[acetyl-CoA-carboxylase] ligase BirA-like protein